MASELKDVFPLNIVAPALESFQPPQGDLSIEGEWTHRYGLYTIGQRSMARAGSVSLRRVAARSGPILHLDYRKHFAGRFQNAVAAELHGLGGALATPSRWRVAFESLGPDGKPVPHTRIEKLGKAQGKTIEIRNGKATRSFPRPAAFTINWALFDVVQRLPRERFEPMRFTLLDDFDEPKPNHVLSYRGSAEVMMGGRRVQQHRWQELAKGRIRTTTWGREGDRPVRLHAFDHLGDAMVPEVYWVDDQGRLLFVVAGIEAYLWEPADEKHNQ